MKPLMAKTRDAGGQSPVAKNPQSGFVPTKGGAGGLPAAEPACYRLNARVVIAGRDLLRNVSKRRARAIVESFIATEDPADVAHAERTVEPGGQSSVLGHHRFHANGELAAIAAKKHTPPGTPRRYHAALMVGTERALGGDGRVSIDSMFDAAAARAGRLEREGVSMGFGRVSSMDVLTEAFGTSHQDLTIAWEASYIRRGVKPPSRRPTPADFGTIDRDGFRVATGQYDKADLTPEELAVHRRGSAMLEAAGLNEYGFAGQDDGDDAGELAGGGKT